MRRPFAERPALARGRCGGYCRAVEWARSSKPAARGLGTTALMANAAQPVRVYEELADWYDRQGQAKLRDWFLVLAADAALAGGRVDEAERLRGQLLYLNPHHLLKPFASFAEALKSPDVM